jgi:hypothetical protein
MLVPSACTSSRRFRIAQSSCCDDSCTPSLREEYVNRHCVAAQDLHFRVADPSETAIGSLVAHRGMVYCCIPICPPLVGYRGSRPPGRPERRRPSR